MADFLKFKTKFDIIVMLSFTSKRLEIQFGLLVAGTVSISHRRFGGTVTDFIEGKFKPKLWDRGKKIIPKKAVDALFFKIYYNLYILIFW